MPLLRAYLAAEDAQRWQIGASQSEPDVEDVDSGLGEDLAVVKNPVQESLVDVQAERR